jgi:hypothetical protein
MWAAWGGGRFPRKRRKRGDPIDIYVYDIYMYIYA